jgi:hypothetical protein
MKNDDRRTVKNAVDQSTTTRISMSLEEEEKLAHDVQSDRS